MICTLLTFFCFAWQISPSLSACAQAAVNVSFGSLNASFFACRSLLHAKNEAFGLPKLTLTAYQECAKTHHLDVRNPKIFWGGGTAPSPDPTPRGEGDTPSPHPTPSAPRSSRLRRSTSAPSAPRSSHLCNDKYYLF